MTEPPFRGMFLLGDKVAPEAHSRAKLIRHLGRAAQSGMLPSHPSWTGSGFLPSQPSQRSMDDAPDLTHEPPRM